MRIRWQGSLLRFMLSLDLAGVSSACSIMWCWVVRSNFFPMFEEVLKGSPANYRFFMTHELQTAGPKSELKPSRGVRRRGPKMHQSRLAFLSRSRIALFSRQDRLRTMRCGGNLRLASESSQPNTCNVVVAWQSPIRRCRRKAAIAHWPEIGEIPSTSRHRSGPFSCHTISGNILLESCEYSDWREEAWLCLKACASSHSQPTWRLPRCLFQGSCEAERLKVHKSQHPHRT